MTKSYAQIKATIAKLEKEAAALRATEATKVVAQIKESIVTFGLKVEQLFGRGAKALKAAAGKALGGGKAAQKAARKGAGIPKHRDPKTGKRWTGFGKAPRWIATARNRDKFLIDQLRISAMVTDDFGNVTVLSDRCRVAWDWIVGRDDLRVAERLLV